MGLNGGKTLTRIALDDPGTVATMEATAKAVVASIVAVFAADYVLTSLLTDI